MGPPVARGLRLTEGIGVDRAKGDYKRNVQVVESVSEGSSKGGRTKEPRRRRKGEDGQRLRASLKPDGVRMRPEPLPGDEERDGIPSESDSSGIVRMGC